MKTIKLRFNPGLREFEKLIESYGDKLAEELAKKLGKCYSMYKHDERFKKIFKIQATILRAIREYLDSRGFVEILPPIVGPTTDPGTKDVGQASIEFYGYKYKVMSGVILHKQMMVDILGKIYLFSPNVRIEPPETLLTGRHLAEFFRVDVEIRDATYYDAMEVAERLFEHAVNRVCEEHWRDLEAMGRILEIRRPPYPRLTYREALRVLSNMGYEVKYGVEIPWDQERVLSAAFETPFFIIDYPKESRDFYEREDPERPGILRDFDMLYPEGFGEAASGAEREYEYDKVVRRMLESGENPAKYGWYVDMLKEGISPSAGFSMGIERLTRYVCGLPAVWEARPYPKVPGIVPTP
ncbi:MAG: asparagine ligase [Thermoprotei archaeon]|nr:MAG: asparagine ligase [Thermoprotei archaeon]